MKSPSDPVADGRGRTPWCAVPKRVRARRRSVKGWSLIELMVALVIIGLLAGIVGPRVLGYLERGQVQTVEAQVKMLSNALLTYRLDVGRFPTTQQGLKALTTAPQDSATFWNGPYLEDEVPLDPWNTPYRYESPADTIQGFALYSLGADSALGGEDSNAEIGIVPEKRTS